MKVAEGRIIKGAVITKARFPEGAKLTLVQHDDRPAVSLTPDEEAGILKGIQEIAQRRGIPLSRIRAKLRRR